MTLRLINSCLHIKGFHGCVSSLNKFRFIELIFNYRIKIYSHKVLTISSVEVNQFKCD